MLLGLLAGVLVYQTYEDYSKQPIISNLRVAFNKSVSLPNGTLCLPLYLGELNDDQESDISFSKELDAFFQEEEGITKEAVLNYRLNWTNSFRHVVHSYLIEISKYEYTEDNRLPNMGEENELLLARRMLETKLLELNISIDELRQKFGNETATLYSLVVKEFGIDPLIYEKYRLIDLGRTTFIGEEQICYQLHFNLIPLNRHNDITIYVYEGMLPNPKYLRGRRDWILIDLLGRTHVDTRLIGMTDSTYAAVFGQFTTLQVDFATLYQALPALDQLPRCSTEIPIDECREHCRTRAIQVIIYIAISLTAIINSLCRN